MSIIREADAPPMFTRPAPRVFIPLPLKDRGNGMLGQLLRLISLGDCTVTGLAQCQIVFDELMVEALSQLSGLDPDEAQNVH